MQPRAPGCKAKTVGLRDIGIARNAPRRLNIITVRTPERRLMCLRQRVNLLDGIWNRSKVRFGSNSEGAPAYTGTSR